MSEQIKKSRGRPKKVISEESVVEKEIPFKERLHNKDVYNMIVDSVEERKRTIEAIKNIFPNIEDSIYLNKFEELLKSDKKFEYNEEFSSSLTGEDLINSLMFNAGQQFCFWVDSANQDRRHLSSSDFKDITISNYLQVIEKSMTLRENRIRIMNEHYAFWADQSHPTLRDRTEIKTFQLDFFRKKKNLFKMFMVRFGIVKDQEFINTINPAIDYQIPKMLRAFDIIEYPIALESKINAGKIIPKDSTEELFIRSISYMALVMIQEKYKFDQVKLDWWLWSNRRNPLVQKVKHHCTITEDY